jgi:hypothetical protein
VTCCAARVDCQYLCKQHHVSAGCACAVYADVPLTCSTAKPRWIGPISMQRRLRPPAPAANERIAIHPICHQRLIGIIDQPHIQRPCHRQCMITSSRKICLMLASCIHTYLPTHYQQAASRVTTCKSSAFRQSPPAIRSLRHPTIIGPAPPRLICLCHRSIPAQVQHAPALLPAYTHAPPYPYVHKIIGAIMQTPMCWHKQLHNCCTVSTSVANAPLYVWSPLDAVRVCAMQYQRTPHGHCVSLVLI